MKEAIRNAFEGDDDIFKFFDPNYDLKNIDEVVDNVYKKILEHQYLFDTEFITLKNGYFFIVKQPKLLVSFGINKNNRNKEELNKFWDKIKDKLGNNFDCFLWSKNKRAINWLVKMGMKIEKEVLLDNHKIIKLCQQGD
jgi:hypothetical protein